MSDFTDTHNHENSVDGASGFERAFSGRHVRRAMTQVPGLGWLGRRLESVMFGKYERRYRQFVRLVVVVTLALVLQNGVVQLGLMEVGATTAAWLQTAGAVAVAAFVLVGTLQLLVLGRVLDRESTTVAQQAATLEAQAEEVTETADELESTADTLESTADELEERADKLEAAAETLAETATEAEAEIGGQTQSELVEQASELREEAAELRDETVDAKAQTSDAKSQTETVKETSEDVSEQLAEEKDQLPGEPAAEETDSNEDR